MDEDFYKRCVVCFDNEVELIKCSQCVYHICKHYVVDIGKLDVHVCKERECRYEYLEDDEECHCYVCKTKTTDIVFNCPTCSLKRNYKLTDFTEEIKERITFRGKGLKKFSGYSDKLSDYVLVFFKVMDLDTGNVELLSFRARRENMNEKFPNP